MWEEGKLESAVLLMVPIEPFGSILGGALLMRAYAMALLEDLSIA